MQINIAAFFYIGALSDALGHANRAAKLLHNAAAIARNSGDVDALTLKRNPKPSRRRTSSRRDSAEVKTCVAEFSEVTIKNPFNITLIKDLSMQVRLHLHCAIAPSRIGIILHNCSPPPPITQPHPTHSFPSSYSPAKAASSPAPRAVASPRCCASWASCGRQSLAPFEFRSMSDQTASFFCRNVR
jgi:hypothetical protein